MLENDRIVSAALSQLRIETWNRQCHSNV